MVTARLSILTQIKEAADELSALKARSHGAARGKRKHLRQQASKTQDRLILLVSDLLDTQRSEQNGA